VAGRREAEELMEEVVDGNEAVAEQVEEVVEQSEMVVSERQSSCLHASDAPHNAGVVDESEMVVSERKSSCLNTNTGDATHNAEASFCLSKSVKRDHFQIYKIRIWAYSTASGLTKPRRRAPGIENCVRLWLDSPTTSLALFIP